MEKNKKWNYEIYKAESSIHIFDAADPTVAIASIYADPLSDNEYEIAKLICQAPTLSDQLTQLKEEKHELECEKQDLECEVHAKKKFIEEILLPRNKQLEEALRGIINHKGDAEQGLHTYINELTDIAKAALQTNK